MLQTSSPAVSRRWLAFEVKRMRQRAGMSQAAVAKAIGSQVPKVSLIETGQRHIQKRDLETLLPLFGVPENRWDEYFTAARHAHEKGWWEAYDENTVPSWFQRFVGLEQGANRLRTYEPAVIPGLLQTPDYAAAVLDAAWPDASEEKIAQLVGVRMRRQHALWRERPLHMWAIVDEAAVRQAIGSREIMGTQLRHISDVATRHEHVSVQVVPFSSAGAVVAVYGAFTILNFGWPNDSGVVYLEHLWGADFLQTLEETNRYAVLFDRLRELALPQAESIELVRHSLEEHTA